MQLQSDYSYSSLSQNLDLVDKLCRENPREFTTLLGASPVGDMKSIPAQTCHLGNARNPKTTSRKTTSRQEKIARMTPDELKRFKCKNRLAYRNARKLENKKKEKSMMDYLNLEKRIKITEAEKCSLKKLRETLLEQIRKTLKENPEFGKTYLGLKTDGTDPI
jgi:hypothetical protein